MSHSSFEYLSQTKNILHIIVEIFGKNHHQNRVKVVKIGIFDRERDSHGPISLKIVVVGEATLLKFQYFMNNSIIL